jgi:hypothetical protein
LSSELPDSLFGADLEEDKDKVQRQASEKIDDKKEKLKKALEKI